MHIKIEREVAQAKLDSLGVNAWPLWRKEPSNFTWHYDVEEISYIVHGVVVVTPDGGEPVMIRTGDFVTFPAGLSCRWEIREELLKHYHL